MTSSPTEQAQRGFTLAELAIVLVIVGVLLGGLIMPLTAQLDARNLADTTRSLNDAREALMGFAASNGRLPCPATAASNGIEAPEGGGMCAAPFAGYLPAASLGLTPTDTQGYAIDAWGNRLRYAVTPYNNNLYTTANALKTNWPLADGRALLNLSSTAASGGIKLADNAIAVIFSVGRNQSASPGLDESRNLDNDRFFVSHDPTSAASPGGEFDDMITWLAEPLLFNRLIAAGRLP